MRRGWTLMRLRGYAGRSEIFLIGHDIKYVFKCCEACSFPVVETLIKQLASLTVIIVNIVSAKHEQTKES